MSVPLLTTKFYIPPVRPKLVSRPRLAERLNTGMGRSGSFSEGQFARKLTLVSAPAGYGKTTLLSECAAHCGWPVAWLSLDERDFGRAFRNIDQGDPSGHPAEPLLPIPIGQSHLTFPSSR